MKKIYIVLMVVVFSRVLFANEILGFVSVSTGVDLIKFDNFNKELLNLGLQPLTRSNYGFVGVGSNSLVLNKLYIGLYYNHMVGETIDNNEIIIATSGSNNGLDLGYNVFNFKSFLFIPTLGISGNRFKLTAFDKTVDYKSLADVFSSPKKEIAMEINSFDIKPAIEIMWMFSKKEKYNLSIAYKMGVSYSVGERYWELSDLGQIISAPLPQKTKFFISFDFLIGSGYNLDDR